MTKAMRLLMTFATCMSISAQSNAQALGLTTPTLLEISSPLIYEALPVGAVVDLSAYTIKAIAPMSALVIVRSPATTPSNPGPQNMHVTIKLGMLNANGLAQNALYISETTDSIIDVLAAVGASSNCVWLDGGNFMTANNRIRIGAIYGCNGNALLLQTHTNDGTYNVQGNQIQVGQIFGNNGSGVVAWTGAFANSFTVGPIEHNVYFGCYDGSGGTGWFANRWYVNGVNSNGMVHVC